MPLHQWDYIFAFATIFVTLDAYNIGANDVANSFATSVASRSLTLKQACLAAAICEFSGALLVGGRVTKTIQDQIIPLSTFNDNPGLQLLGFTVALMASSTWLMFATYQSWPVSTTYSIVSAVVGVGIALSGFDSVNWAWNGGKGVSAIFSGFLIAPAMSAAFAATIYTLTRYFVLSRKESTRVGLCASPIYWFTVAAILTMSIVYKGAPTLDVSNFSNVTTAVIIIGTAAGVMLLSLIFWLPFVYARVIRHDYTIRWYHIFIGPLLWFRKSPVHPAGSPISAVPDYGIALNDFASRSGSLRQNDADYHHRNEQTIDGPWFFPKNLWLVLRWRVLPFIKRLMIHGTQVDVLRLQAGDTLAEAQRLHNMHKRVTTYSNNTEHLYSFVQVLTACTASFAHGANDVANAIGPYAVIFHVWSTSTTAGPTSNVPVWILAYGGGMIVIGLATYGYNIMRVLGNRLTLHSPSRGFSMELGSATTVLLASQYGIPVSTTMCITGATLGVALCNKDYYKAFNWRGLARIFMSWVLTIPIVATASGCLMAFIVNAPRR